MGRGSGAAEEQTAARRSSGLEQAITRIAALGPGELPTHEDFATLCSFEYRPAGLRTEVDNVEDPGDDQLVLDGRVLLGAEKVGEVQHWCRRDGRGREHLMFKPATIELEPGSQGHGFGRALHRALVERWRAAGSHRIEILAERVGSYAWAIEGYEIHTYWPRAEPELGPEDNPALPAAAVLLDQATRMRTMARLPDLTSAISPLPFASRVPEALIEELDRRVIGEEGNQAFIRPPGSPAEFIAHVREITAGKITRPRELALFGREAAWTDEEGRQTWLGRELLLLDGVEWRGVMYL